MAAVQQNRDIVVIGSSAGGIEALTRLVSALPGDLPATFFVAQHMSPTHSTRLAEVLSSRGPYRALYPVHEQEIAPGHIYVAPPDMQMLVRPGYVHVTRGPKENGHRPSVDALFRTAARAYGPRVVAVVLTGYLDCGTAGLMSVKARGGVALVQDPEDAHAPEMPASAIRNVAIDRVAPLDGLAAALSELVRAPAGTLPATTPRLVTELEGDEPGVPAELVCPHCRGVLTEVSTSTFVQFRCHVGHAFSLHSMLLEQNEATERALWAAVRALEESAALADRMQARSEGGLRDRFAEKHETLTGQAELIKAILLGSKREAPTLPPETEATAPAATARRRG